MSKKYITPEFLGECTYDVEQHNVGNEVGFVPTNTQHTLDGVAYIRLVRFIMQTQYSAGPVLHHPNH